MFEEILNSLNLWSMLLMMFTMLVGIGLGVLTMSLMKPANRVLYVREKDRRGQELPVEEEDSLAIETRSKPPLRFFKYAPSFEILNRFNRRSTIFIGKEGTAYTWKVHGYDEEPVKWESVVREYEDEEGNIVEETTEVPIKTEPKKIMLTFNSLADFLRKFWGNEFYNQIPEIQREMVQTNTINVTVGLEPGLTPDDFTPITEVDINRKGDEDMARIFHEASVDTGMRNILEKVAWMGAGGCVIFMFAMFFGWIAV